MIAHLVFMIRLIFVLIIKFWCVFMLVSVLGMLWMVELLGTLIIHLLHARVRSPILIVLGIDTWLVAVLVLL